MMTIPEIVDVLSKFDVVAAQHHTVNRAGQSQYVMTLTIEEDTLLMVEASVEDLTLTLVDWVRDMEAMFDFDIVADEFGKLELSHPDWDEDRLTAEAYKVLETEVEAGNFRALVPVDQAPGVETAVDFDFDDVAKEYDIVMAANPLMSEFDAITETYRRLAQA